MSGKTRRIKPSELRRSMLIALTYNIKVRGSADEAEFDSRVTIDAVQEALSRAGHHVERVEVTGPASPVLARLEAIAPDLVFNMAEGQKGKTREAFFPALFDELGVAYTGSDAHTLCITLDKTLTKRSVLAYGVPTARSRLITRASLEHGGLDGVEFPVIVKPNFEGSSKGISAERSVCQDETELIRRVETELSSYPAGLLVERFVPGVDTVCGFVEGASADGVLDPLEVVVDPAYANLYNVYDYHLKSVRAEHVSFRAPTLAPSVLDHLRDLTRRAVRALDIRDLGRVDFRVSKTTNEVVLLEADALPSLDERAPLFAACKHRGMDFDSFIRAIVQSACKRNGLQALLDSTGSKRSVKKNSLKVGFTYNLKRGHEEHEAEFDSPKTIQAITSAIESFGHSVIPLEATPDLPRRLLAAAPDVVFNIAEGVRGRGREAQVPAMLELLGIPYSGSDPTTLSLCLDKGLTKQILRAARIETPEWQVLTTGREKLKPLRYPVIVKPNAEGTSKGISSASVVHDEPSVRALVKQLVEKFGQSALVEEYIAGREITVGLLGERRPRVLPPLEVVFGADRQYPVYGYAEKQEFMPTMRFDCPANLTPAEQKRVEKTCRDTFAALNCRDVARIDLRMAKDGTVFVIECNPLPGLTPDFSDLCIIAKVASMDYRTLVGEILAGCIKRFREESTARALPRLARTDETPHEG